MDVSGSKNVDELRGGRGTCALSLSLSHTYTHTHPRIHKQLAILYQYRNILYKRFISSEETGVCVSPSLPHHFHHLFLLHIFTHPHRNASACTRVALVTSSTISVIRHGGGCTMTASSSSSTSARLQINPMLHTYTRTNEYYSRETGKLR